MVKGFFKNNFKTILDDSLVYHGIDRLLRGQFVIIGVCVWVTAYLYEWDWEIFGNRVLKDGTALKL